MGEYLCEPPPYDFHRCQTPDPKRLTFNTIWRCDCGQVFVCRFKMFSSDCDGHWKRISFWRAKLIIKDQKTQWAWAAKREAKKRRPLVGAKLDVPDNPLCDHCGLPVVGDGDIGNEWWQHAGVGFHFCGPANDSYQGGAHDRATVNGSIFVHPKSSGRKALVSSRWATRCGTKIGCSSHSWACGSSQLWRGRS